jgi:outer membrane protein
MFTPLLTAFALTATAPAWSLGDCLALTAQNQPQLEAARAGARAAEASAGSSLGALGPQVSGTAQATRGTAPQSSQSAQTALPAYDIFSAGLQGTWVLWDGGRFYGWRAAQAGAEAAGLGTSLAENEAANATAFAFYGLQFAERMLEVRRRIAAATQELSAQAAQLVAAGRQAPIDAVRAEAALATAQADLVQAETARGDAASALLTAMGLPLATPFAVTGPAAAPLAFAYDVTAYTRLLLAREPGLEALRRQAQAARLAQTAAEWGHLPTLNAGAGYGWRSPDAAAWKPAWNLGLTLNVPLFASGLTANRAAEQAGRAEQLAAQLRGIEQRTAQAASAYVSAFANAARRFSALETAQRAADANLALALGRYRAGAGSIIEVVDAELLVANTAVAHAAGLRDLQTARARALTAAGLALTTESP